MNSNWVVQNKVGKIFEGYKIFPSHAPNMFDLKKI
jgi:hypothetical protein